VGWAGIDNTAEATAAGALYSDAAGKVAVLAKTTRNAMIGFVVLAYAIYWLEEARPRPSTTSRVPVEEVSEVCLGFLLMSLLVGFHVFSKGQVASLGNLSKWAFLLTFAGVGLRTNFRDMSKQGLRRLS